MSAHVGVLCFAYENRGDEVADCVCKTGGPTVLPTPGSQTNTVQAFQPVSALTAQVAHTLFLTHTHTHTHTHTLECRPSSSLTTSLHSYDEAALPEILTVNSLHLNT